MPSVNPASTAIASVLNSVAQNSLRCYGYGVPNLGKTLSGAENAATLLYEGDIQPFCTTASGCKANEIHLHEIPWPK